MSESSTAEVTATVNLRDIQVLINEFFAHFYTQAM